jgi:ParB family chromosome partitioning protein
LLVAGRHRLEAAKSLGWTEIDTFVLDGDDTDARLWEIAENLHRKELNDLERSVYIAEWFELAKRQFGQVVQKPEGGRPEGGIAEAARLLPVPGKTEDGKRKTIERALKIAAITPEAKEAAAAAGLADNQHALLGVAGEKTKEEQLKKVAKLASRKRAKRKKTPAVRVETPATAPSADLPSFRTSEQETEALTKHIANIGHDIDPNDLIVALGSNSAKARPSEYAVIRVPRSHPDRNKLKETIRALAREYNAGFFFKTLPTDPNGSITEDVVDEDGEAGHDD